MTIAVAAQCSQLQELHLSSGLVIGISEQMILRDLLRMVDWMLVTAFRAGGPLDDRCRMRKIVGGLWKKEIRDQISTGVPTQEN